MEENIKLRVTCPACEDKVEVVVRELSVIAKGNGTLEATFEASTYKHRCKRLGAGSI